MAMKAPKYMPLPIPGGSLRGAEMGISRISSMKEASAEQRFRDSSLGKILDKANPELRLSNEQIEKL